LAKGKFKKGLSPGFQGGLNWPKGWLELLFGVKGLRRPGIQIGLIPEKNCQLKEGLRGFGPESRIGVGEGSKGSLEGGSYPTEVLRWGPSRGEEKAKGSLLKKGTGYPSFFKRREVYSGSKLEILLLGGENSLH